MSFAEQRVVVAARQLGEQAGELLVGERLAKRREHGARVIERLLVSYVLPFGDAGDELVE
jgi:hypothetical protein